MKHELEDKDRAVFTVVVLDGARRASFRIGRKQWKAPVSKLVTM